MGKSLRVLILEDDQSDAELEIEILELEGYSCKWTRVESERSFRENLDKKKYDLILADYNLPDINGLTALKIFKEKEINIPFILVSGVMKVDIAVISIKNGATDYVLKNHISKLGAIVKKALSEFQS